MDNKNPALHVIIIRCMIVRQVYKGALETVYLDNPIAETTWILILQTQPQFGPHFHLFSREIIPYLLYSLLK